MSASAYKAFASVVFCSFNKGSSTKTSKVYHVPPVHLLFTIILLKPSLSFYRAQPLEKSFSWINYFLSYYSSWLWFCCFCSALPHFLRFKRLCSMFGLFQLCLPDMTSPSNLPSWLRGSLLFLCFTKQYRHCKPKVQRTLFFSLTLQHRRLWTWFTTCLIWPKLLSPLKSSSYNPLCGYSLLFPSLYLLCCTGPKYRTGCAHNSSSVSSKLQPPQQNSTSTRSFCAYMSHKAKPGHVIVCSLLMVTLQDCSVCTPLCNLVVSCSTTEISLYAERQHKAARG